MRSQAKQGRKEVTFFEKKANQRNFKLRRENEKGFHSVSSLWSGQGYSQVAEDRVLILLPRAFVPDSH